MRGVVVQSVAKTFHDSKTKAEVEVLRDISFAAKAGEFVAILGPSGCGKSTLMRTIAGLETATSGSIRIDDEEVTQLPAAQRNLAMVFQNYALFPHLSVAQNMEFGLKARKVAKKLRQERIEETARLLELTPYLQRRPSELSGGQRQRVALGRALVSGHKLILMDEPLSNLDARLRAEMRRELRRLQKELGLTVLYVTHDQVEAMTMADRVIVLRDGKIDQFATPEELYNSPANVHVARFIGSPPMNIVQISDVALGIRPEQLAVHAVGSTPAQGNTKVASVRLKHQELLGADRLTIWEYLGAAEPQEIIVRSNPADCFHIGMEAELHAPETAIHQFHPTDGGAIAKQPAYSSTLTA